MNISVYIGDAGKAAIILETNTLQDAAGLAQAIINGAKEFDVIQITISGKSPQNKSLDTQ